MFAHFALEFVHPQYFPELRHVSTSFREHVDKHWKAFGCKSRDINVLSPENFAWTTEIACLVLNVDKVTQLVIQYVFVESGHVEFKAMDKDGNQLDVSIPANPNQGSLKIRKHLHQVKNVILVKRLSCSEGHILLCEKFIEHVIGSRGTTSPVQPKTTFAHVKVVH